MGGYEKVAASKASSDMCTMRYVYPNTRLIGPPLTCTQVNEQTGGIYSAVLEHHVDAE